MVDAYKSQSTQFLQTNQKFQTFPVEKTRLTEVIKAMTNNKGIGMTEAEWNEIVKTNAKKEKEDADRKKEIM